MINDGIFVCVFGECGCGCGCERKLIINVDGGVVVVVGLTEGLTNEKTDMKFDGNKYDLVFKK